MKIIALDFDGVLCNSVEEMAVTSFNTAQKLFPHIIMPAVRSADYIKDFSTLRPVIKFGFEGVMLCLLIINNTEHCDILDNFTGLAQDLRKELGIQNEILEKKFSHERDNFITDETTQWLDLHTYYPGTISTLRELQKLDIPLFIITTKEKRFVCRLLQSQDLHVSENCIFGMDEGKKIDILQQLTAREKFQNGTFYFIEDRLKTLVEVSENKCLNSIKLFLANWGYNTENQRKTAENHSRISLISLSDFNQMRFISEKQH